MYALGFNHDHYYPVRVVCENCPKSPWDFIQAAPNNRNLEEDSVRGTRIFIPALLEVKMDGHKIENFEDQGVSWEEFNDFSGLTKEQKTVRDAFVLLMGFVHHADSKPDQQRLSCVKSSATKIEGKKYDCKRLSF